VFALKKKVAFSNGRFVGAADFKYSFERVLRPSTRSTNTWVFEKIAGADEFMAGRAAEVRGIRVIDEYTLGIELEKPFAPFLNLLTMTAAYVVPVEETERWGKDFSSRPVGTGPFTVKEWSPNRMIQLDRRDGYFGRCAKVAGILYRIIPEDLTAVVEFELGNIDVLTLPASEYSRYRDDVRRSAYISSLEGLNTYYLGFNCGRPSLDDAGLRQALFSAIDREKILGTIYEKRGRLAAGPVPDRLRRWKKPVSARFDPGTAKTFIQKKGYEGVKLRFFVTADQEVVDIAEVIQSYLRDAGIAVEIRQLE